MKKLMLNKETLTTLQASETQDVAAGRPLSWMSGCLAGCYTEDFGPLTRCLDCGI